VAAAFDTGAGAGAPGASISAPFEPVFLVALDFFFCFDVLAEDGVAFSAAGASDDFAAGFTEAQYVTAAARPTATVPAATSTTGLIDVVSILVDYGYAMTEIFLSL
jgi:hypothetical protein